jgi:hypothetical protein
VLHLERLPSEKEKEEKQSSLVTSTTEQSEITEVREDNLSAWQC